MTFEAPALDGAGVRIPGGWGCPECGHAELDPLPVAFLGGARIPDPDAVYEAHREKIDRERRAEVAGLGAPVVLGEGSGFFRGYTPRGRVAGVLVGVRVNTRA